MVSLWALTSLGMMGENPVGRTTDFNEPLIVPEPYAFAIWSVIYTGLIAFPIYQLFKKSEDHPLWNSVRTWFSLNVICNGLWLVAASYSFQWTTVGIIVFMLISLYKLNEFLIKIKEDGGKVNFWGERLVFSLYFAWITLATVLNVSAALKFYQWDGFGLSEVTWSLIILPVAVAITTAAVWKYRDTGYAVVVIWAFVALVVKHWGENPSIAYLAIGVVLLFLGLIFARGRQTKIVAT